MDRISCGMQAGCSRYRQRQAGILEELKRLTALESQRLLRLRRAAMASGTRQGAAALATINRELRSVEGAADYLAVVEIG